MISGGRLIAASAVECFSSRLQLQPRRILRDSDSVSYQYASSNFAPRSQHRVGACSMATTDAASNPSAVSRRDLASRPVVGVGLQGVAASETTACAATDACTSRMQIAASNPQRCCKRGPANAAATVVASALLQTAASMLLVPCGHQTKCRPQTTLHSQQQYGPLNTVALVNLRQVSGRDALSPLARRRAQCLRLYGLAFIVKQRRCCISGRQLCVHPPAHMSDRAALRCSRQSHGVSVLFAAASRVSRCAAMTAPAISSCAPSNGLTAVLVRALGLFVCLQDQGVQGRRPQVSVDSGVGSPHARPAASVRAVARGH